MSLVVGQRMVRTDDGMRGVVELTAMPGFEQYEELRIVYFDRGERRIAGKREAWEPEKTPSRKLRLEEVLRVAYAADWALRSLDKNELPKWWELEQWPGGVPAGIHDIGLLNTVIDYLQKRG